MDIHKPKPWHGVREFLKEYVIIVVGVLTALAAEQVVDRLHWRQVMAEQREILNANLQGNDYAMRARLRLEPCVERRLGEVEELFRRHDAGERLGIAGPISRPHYVLGGTHAWDLAVADGSLAHMSLRDKGRYDSAFIIWTSYRDMYLAERENWRQLQVLDQADKLTEGDWSALRRVFAAARDDDQQMRDLLTPANYLNVLPALGLRSLPVRRSDLEFPGLAELCRPMLMNGRETAR